MRDRERGRRGVGGAESQGGERFLEGITVNLGGVKYLGDHYCFLSPL